MGTQIYARAWELLTAMVIMGALFGISVSSPFRSTMLISRLSSQPET